MATAKKNFLFILSEISDFHMVINLSMTVVTILMRILTSLSVNEIFC